MAEQASGSVGDLTTSRRQIAGSGRKRADHYDKAGGIECGGLIDRSSIVCDVSLKRFDRERRHIGRSAIARNRETGVSDLTGDPLDAPPLEIPSPRANASETESRNFVDYAFNRFVVAERGRIDRAQVETCAQGAQVLALEAIDSQEATHSMGGQVRLPQEPGGIRQSESFCEIGQRTHRLGSAQHYEMILVPIKIGEEHDPRFVELCWRPKNQANSMEPSAQGFGHMSRCRRAQGRRALWTPRVRSDQRSPATRG